MVDQKRKVVRDAPHLCEAGIGHDRDIRPLLSRRMPITAVAVSPSLMVTTKAPGAC